MNKGSVLTGPRVGVSVGFSVGDSSGEAVGSSVVNSVADGRSVAVGASGEGVVNVDIMSVVDGSFERRFLSTILYMTTADNAATSTAAAAISRILFLRGLGFGVRAEAAPVTDRSASFTRSSEISRIHFLRSLSFIHRTPPSARTSQGRS